MSRFYSKEDGNFMEEANNLKKSVPKFVGTYTRILQLIQEGVYARGSRIPSEPELAKMMGVSRMTLRQALALLQEDGIIETIHGQGNYVKKSPAQRKEGLEKRGNPIYKCIGEEIDRVDTKYRLDVSDSYTSMIFQRETAVFIGVTRTYYAKNECVGFSFSYIPADIDELQPINMNEEDMLDEFLDRILYEKAYAVHTSVKAVGVNKEFKEEVPFKSELPYSYLLKESVMNAAGEVLAYTKYSMMLDQVEFEINQYN